MRFLRQSSLPSLPRRCSALKARLTRLRDESGSALVELALITSLLGVPLLLGTVHFSTLLIDSIVVSNAAHAGAEYGMTSSTFAQDSVNIQAAAQEDASGLGTTLTVNPSVIFYCSASIGGTSYSTQAQATAVCPAGQMNHALEFVQVIANATVTPIVSFPGAPSSVNLSSTSIMEVEE